MGRNPFDFETPADDPGERVVHHYVTAHKSGGTAAVLEVLPGLFLHTFGIGHMYAGHVGRGLVLMFGWWIVAFVNALLCTVFIGFVTWPLCWIAMMILSPILASKSCRTR